MATETRLIKIKIEGKGSSEIRKLSKEFGTLSKSSQQTSSTLSKLRSSFNTLFGVTLAGVGIKSLVDTADNLQLLRDRIRAFEGASADQTFSRLAEAAAFTRTSISSLAESYNRLALATKDLGVDSDALIGLTTTLQQSFRLSGSSIAESTAATIQLSQGLASGQLRGQELRSVLEQNAVIGGILAKQFNVSRGELIKFAEAGKITSSEVLTALANNADTLNKNAETLGQTFGQTLTIAFDKFNLQIDRLNRTFGLNSAFQKGVEFFIDNLDVLGALLAATTVTALVAGLFSLTAALGSTNLAFIALNAQLIAFQAISFITASINPVLAAVFLLSGAVTFLALNWEKAEIVILAASQNIQLGIVNAVEFISQNLGELARFAGLNELSSSLLGFAKDLNQLGGILEGNITTLATDLEKLENAANGNNIAKQTQDLKDFAATLKDADTTGKFKDQLKLLNNEFSKDGNVAKYEAALSKIKIAELNRQFNEGEKDLRAFNKELAALSDVGLTQLNEQFRKGEISVSEYSLAINKLDLKRVEQGVQAGTSSFNDLRKAIVATQETVTSDSFQQGLADYINSAGTLSQNVASAVNNTFKNLEDTFVDFIETGKFRFKDFASSIISELNRIVVRQLIIKQLANGIGSAFGVPALTEGGGATAATPNAKGNAFGPRGIIPFASGGVVSSPTLFGFGGGKTGLMGEAGAEAILPLTRSRDGDLGVKATPSNVNVNIINNSQGTEISQTERSDSFGNKTLDIIIQSKVKEGIGNGSFDTLFKSNFGLERKGF